MGRRYSLSGENLTLGTGNVLAAIQSAAAGSAGAILEIERVEVTQSGTTSSAQVRLALGSRTTAGTLTLTSATPAPLVIGGPASGISGSTGFSGGAGMAAHCGVNSSADSSGTYTPAIVCNPNNQGGYAWIPVPEQKIVVPPSTLFVAYFLAAPATTTGWTVDVYFHEVF